LTYTPCRGMTSIMVATPIIAAKPISRHIKYDITSVCNGPTHRYTKKLALQSNRLTSFDMRFTACPTVVSLRAVLLSLSVWNTEF
jgi:hypothetical protein